MFDDETLPDGWLSANLGEVTNEQNLRVGSVDQAPVVLSSTKHFGLVPSNEFFKNRTIYSDDLSNYKRTLKNWFAYATNHLAEGSIGRQKRFDDACVSPIYTVFSCTDAVLPEYMERLLKSSQVIDQYKVHEQATVDRRGAVRYKDFSRVAITVPAIPEQEKIVVVLDTLDTTIRQTEAIIAKLKQVKQGLLHDLLTRGIDANGELRPPQSEAPHLYKASPLGWIPLTWHAIHMHEAIRELSQGWSPDCETEAAGSDAWGVLKTTSIVWEGYSDQENKALPSTFAPRPELEVLPHDILITRAGPKERVAVVAYVEQTRQRLMISDKMYRLRLRASDVPAYFALALSSEYAQGAIKRTISGMADSQTNISQPVIRSLEVMRPPTDEQREIAQRVAAFDARLDAEQRYVHASTSLKSGLMDDLLTGRVRVTPLLAQAQATQP